MGVAGQKEVETGERARGSPGGSHELTWPSRQDQKEEPEEQVMEPHAGAPSYMADAGEDTALATL